MKQPAAGPRQIRRPRNALTCRFSAPEAEAPFCGHATIAASAALGQRFGAGTYRLRLNTGEITVDADLEDGRWSAALTSPPTHHSEAPSALLASILAAFAMHRDDLLPKPPAIASAGANHLILQLRDHVALKRMDYDFETVRALMESHDLTTIALIWEESATLFHARNAFAIGGVVEDPATGAAAAAFGGYQRDGSHSDICRFTIVQGETMGQRSILQVDSDGPVGSGIKVAGSVRHIDEGGTPPSLARDYSSAGSLTGTPGCRNRTGTRPSTPRAGCHGPGSRRRL